MIFPDELDIFLRRMRLADASLVGISGYISGSDVDYWEDKGVWN
jgi:hypothetical protein